MIFVYNKNLEIVGVAAEYISAIFSNKYYEVGECELYVIANAENLALYQKGYYIVRSGSDVAYIIKYLEIDTDSENGNFLVVKGYDAKSFLSQRVLLQNLSPSGATEVILRTAVDGCLGSTASADRQIKDGNGNVIFSLGTLAGLNDSFAFSETVTANLGAVVKDACKNLKWGYRVRFNNGFIFEIYQGTDRSDSVEFSPRFDNLKTSQFVDSDLDFANVVVSIMANGSLSDMTETGDGSGAERFEVGSKSAIKSQMTGNEIADLHLGSETAVYTLDGQKHVIVFDYKYLAWDSARENMIQDYLNQYPTTDHTETVGGFTLHTLNVVRCGFINAFGGSSSADMNSTFNLMTFFEDDMMQREAYSLLTEKGDTTTFNASIVPEVSFKLNQDYFLGDIIKITDGAGHSAKARIVEIMEAADENGYSIEPTLEIVED